MNTGEGKTLAATMPLYLNALTGKSCMLVTTNDYLASRDGEEMGEVYSFMGLTCSYPDGNDSNTNKRTDDERKNFIQRTSYIPQTVHLVLTICLIILLRISQIGFCVILIM